MTRSNPSTYPTSTLWTINYLLIFTSCLYGAWLVSAQGNYLYPFWYSQLNIEEHISTYGSQNRYGRRHFTETTSDERFRLFEQIVNEVHEDGSGLDNIQYTVTRAHGEPIQHTLLTHDEVVHLTDVAILIKRLTISGFIVMLLTLLFTALLIRKQVPLPSLKATSLQIGVFLLSLIALVFVIDPQTVFDQFHIWVFPDDHPWFFYYQDSLMSTFMKAPDLFGAIALQILSLTVLVFATVIAITYKLSNVKAQKQSD